MNFWSLNTRFYLTMENRWFLEETPIWNKDVLKSDELYGQGTNVKAMNGLSFLPYDFLENRLRLFLDEKLQFETTGCKSDELLVSKHSFLPYDWKPMVSWWETPIWNNGWKAMKNHPIWNSKSDEETFGRRFYMWKTDGFLMRNQFWNKDVKAMNFWSIKTRFYLTMENRWFLGCKSDELLKLQFETTECKSDELLVSKHSFLPYDGKLKTDGFLMRNSFYIRFSIWNNGCKSDELLVYKDSFLPYDELLVSKTDGFLMVSWEKLQFETRM